MLRAHRVHTLEDRVKVLRDLVWGRIIDPRTGKPDPTGSLRDPLMRRIGLLVTQHCPPRNDLCELKAVFDFVAQNVRYTGDIAGKDTFQSALRTLQFGGGDCFPAGTLMLASGHKLVPVQSLTEGMSIWGLDRWSRVERVWYKGILPVDAIGLNNGSKLKLTGDHHVYVLDCEKHPLNDEKPCSCPIEERTERRITVAELQPGMVLPTPARIPFGQVAQNADDALVDGLYLSDGWHEDTRFAISGQDGCPKEEQKKIVKRICEERGIGFQWSRKYIRINDAEWTLRMQQMGGHAPEKHALSIDLAEGAAASLLRGIMADSGKNTRGGGRTFTSTSRQLWLQTRLLHKMFGITCSERFIEDHGGFGDHPVWRLGVRDQHRSDGHREKLLRVKWIERGVLSVPVWDITTDDHRVYLPEADVTVSQCDDHAGLNVVLAMENGFFTKFRITSNTGASWDHIYALAGVPKHRPTRWVVLDTTLGPGRFMREPPSVKRVDFDVSKGEK